MTAFGSRWNAVANPTEKEKCFVEAIRQQEEVLAKIAYELPLYKYFDTKLTKDLKAAFKVRTFSVLL